MKMMSVVGPEDGRLSWGKSDASKWLTSCTAIADAAWETASATFHSIRALPASHSGHLRPAKPVLHCCQCHECHQRTLGARWWEEAENDGPFGLEMVSCRILAALVY